MVTEGKRVQCKNAKISTTPPREAFICLPWSPPNFHLRPLVEYLAYQLHLLKGRKWNFTHCRPAAMSEQRRESTSPLWVSRSPTKAPITCNRLMVTTPSNVILNQVFSVLVQSNHTTDYLYLVFLSHLLIIPVLKQHGCFKRNLKGPTGAGVDIRLTRICILCGLAVRGIHSTEQLIVSSWRQNLHLHLSELL